MIPQLRPSWAVAAARTMLLGGLFVSSAACAPSLPHLLRTRQYDEALCKVTAGETTSDADRARLVDAFVADSDTRVFLRAVTGDELEASLGARGAQFHRDFVVLIVGVAHAHTSLGGRRIVRFLDRGGPLRMVDAQAVVLAIALHEQLPGEKTIVRQEGRIDRLARALLPEPGKGIGATAGGLATGILELMTFGIVPFTEIFPGKKPDQIMVVRPTGAQLHAAAPATMTVYEGLQRALSEVPKAWMPSAVLLERKGITGVPSVQVEEVLTRSTKSGSGCHLTLTHEQPLLPAPTLEESIVRTFPASADAPAAGGARPARGFETRSVTFSNRAR